MNLTKFIDIVAPLSITSIERIKRLYSELEYIRSFNIDGDLVECGVYKGGNVLGMMEYCYYFDMKNKIWLYDTFSGMTTPKEIDKDFNNIKAENQWGDIVCYAELDQVKYNLSNSNYTNTKYIVGDVCDTLKESQNIPNKIALLRLDTDWFESTKCELENLFPKVVNGGSIIIDDYGHWQGCKKAVDEYFIKHNIKNYENIDYTGIFLRKSIIV